MDCTDLSFNFTGKKALVVGGSQGIGKGVVQALMEAGAIVTYAARTQFSSQTDARFIKTDLSKKSDIKNLFDKIDSAGRLDILINTAALNYFNKVDQISSEEWDNVINVNLTSTFLLCRESIIRMKKQSEGKIVIVSSIAGRNRSIVSGAHYTASKAGVIGLIRQLAFECGQYGININATCPSQTMTDMFFNSMDEGQQKALANSIPIRRIASVVEQVAPILFLCSEGASYITGAVIDVNGGQI